jgi:hypothetical protein
MMTTPDLKEIYNLVVLRIVLQQAELVGTLAWQVAQQVSGIDVIDMLKSQITIRGEPKEAINELIGKYQKLFGKMARDVCKNAVADILADMDANDIPESLR